MSTLKTEVLLRFLRDRQDVSILMKTQHLQYAAVAAY